MSSPAKAWKPADAGTYTISLQAGQVTDGSGQPAEAGVLGTFAVATNNGKGSRSGKNGSRHHVRKPDDD